MEEELEIGDEAPVKRKRGIGKKWIYCRSYPSEEELLEMVRQDGMVCINDATNSKERTHTYKCRVPGCSKMNKFVCKFRQPPEGHLRGQYAWYEVEGSRHIHIEIVVLARGLTDAQKEIINFCEIRGIGKPTEILREFSRRESENQQAGIQVVRAPVKSMISNYLSSVRKRRRGDLNAGGVTLQDIVMYVAQRRNGKNHQFVFL